MTYKSVPDSQSIPVSQATSAVGPFVDRASSTGNGHVECDPPQAAAVAGVFDSHTPTDTQCSGAVVPSGGHQSDETQVALAAGQTADSQAPAEPHSRGAVSIEGSADDQKPIVTQAACFVGRPFNDALLRVYADALDDMEATRIATENRVRALRQAKGMDGTPEEQRLVGVVDALAGIEHKIELDLKRAIREHPLGPWIKRTVGVGEKQGARLLAAIGDPYWHYAQDRPRKLYELYASAGYHVLRVDHTATDHPGQQRDDTQEGLAGQGDTDHEPVDVHTPSVGVAPVLRRGQKANWSQTAKMRAYLVAESCMKQRTSPFRKVYDDGRAKHADAVHDMECKRCGPAGKPAQPGSPLNDGHKHARAMRLVAKAVLKDLWQESRSIHLGEPRG